MKAIIDVLYFLDRVEFINNGESEDYKNFHNIRKVIVDEFVNYDAYKLVVISNLFDLLSLVNENQNVDRVLDADIAGLRGKIFQLVEEGKTNVIQREASDEFDHMLLKYITTRM